MVGQLFTPTFSKEDYSVGIRTDGESHGVVMTKPHVVSLLLDLVGYDPKEALDQCALLEPSCGKGAFVVAAARRLIESARARNVDLETLGLAVFATDIDEAHIEETKANVYEALLSLEVPEPTVSLLVESWIKSADFLLHDFDGRTYDFVVGNPPYIRIEQLSRALLSEYRCRYESMSDRADLYVPFIERSLELLKPHGRLTFICADRWTTNRYGAKLRQLVTARYALKSYVQLDHNAAFETEVSAYPSIFTIGNDQQEEVRVFQLGDATPDRARELSNSIRQGRNGDQMATVYEEWFQNDEPWIMIGPNFLEALRSLESRFGLIEEHGDTRIRIGIATGADKIYIVDRDAEIEGSRLVPLLQRNDIQKGRLHAPEKCVINTSVDSGATIALDEYPRLKAYFESNKALIRKRHVATKDPERWFRTIDRLHRDLVGEPKLIIPDIAGSTEVFLETGKSYPHHNLYFITSKSWDLEVLGGLLSSQVALFFVWSYAIKMRGGYLRFQAQYLRKIRLPEPDSLPEKLKTEIAKAFCDRDFISLDRLALQAYGIETLPDFPFKDTRY